MTNLTPVHPPPTAWVDPHQPASRARTATRWRAAAPRAKRAAPVALARPRARAKSATARPGRRIRWSAHVRPAGERQCFPRLPQHADLVTAFVCLGPHRAVLGGTLWAVQCACPITSTASLAPPAWLAHQDPPAPPAPAPAPATQATRSQEPATPSPALRAPRAPFPALAHPAKVCQRDRSFPILNVAPQRCPGQSH